MNEITAETTAMTKAEGFHEAIEEFVVAAFRAMKTAQDSADAWLLDWNQSLDITRGGIDRLSDHTRTESVFAKLMEQVELNQPVVFEVNEALAGLSAKQVAIEVEDEEEKIEGEKKSKQKLGRCFLLRSARHRSLRNPLRRLSRVKKRSLKSRQCPRKAEKGTRYEDDEKERKKSRYESRPSRQPRDWNVLGKDQEFVERKLLLLPAEGA